MAILTQPARAANFIVSESNGWRSRETVVVDATGGALIAGTVLGKITSSGKFVRHNPSAANGSQNVAGILYEGMDAVEDSKVAFLRDGEVFDRALVYADGATAAQITDTNAGLNDLGIAIRTEK